MQVLSEIKISFLFFLFFNKPQPERGAGDPAALPFLFIHFFLSLRLSSLLILLVVG